MSGVRVGDRLGHLLKLRDRVNQEIATEQRLLLQATQPPDTSVQGRLAALGVDAIVVKQWALEHGLIPEIKRGRISGHLVDAYAVHQQIAGAIARTTRTAP